MTKAVAIVRESPLPARNKDLFKKSTIWRERMEAVMRYPDEWVRVGEFASSQMNSLKKREVDYPSGNFEFTTRTKTPDGVPAVKGKAWLYAKYNGPVA